MIDNRLVIAEDLIIILPIWAWLYHMLYFFVRQAWAKSIDPDETPQTRRLIRVYTVCHSPSLDTTVGSILDLIKFKIKYCKEMGCLNTKGKYGKVTNTEIKWSIISKSVMMVIFVELIDQLLDYPINRASLSFCWPEPRLTIIP